MKVSWFSDGKYVIKRLWEFGKVISCFFYIIYLLEKINFNLELVFFNKWIIWSGVNFGLKMKFWFRFICIL